MYGKIFFLERQFLVKILVQYLVKYYQSVLKNVSNSSSQSYKVGILHNDLIYCMIMLTFLGSLLQQQMKRLFGLFLWSK